MMELLALCLGLGIFGLAFGIITILGSLNELRWTQAFAVFVMAIAIIGASYILGSAILLLTLEGV
jgi:hypothetical protein